MSVFILVTEQPSLHVDRKVKLNINTQKGFFNSFEDAANQASGEEFPFELYPGYSQRRKDRKQHDSGCDIRGV